MILRIKELREEFGLTQKELADKIGNVQRNVSNWENGASEPDLETLLRLADVFGVSLDELFGRYGNKISDPINADPPLFRQIRRLNKKQAEALKTLLSAFCD